MMRCRVLMVILTGTVSVGVSSRVIEASQDVGARKALGKTQLELVVVYDPASFVRAWDAPNRKDTLEIPALDSLRREREFGVDVVFSDCQAGKDGRCALFATYSILTMEGEQLVSMPDVPIWRNTPPPPGRRELGKGVWRTSSEVSDPLGEYLYRAVVVDRVSGQSVTLERRLPLVE